MVEDVLVSVGKVTNHSGRMQKLPRPWHGSYQVMHCNNMNVQVKKVHFPDEE